MEEKEVNQEISYERLQMMVEALKSQNEQLYMQLQNINMNNLFKRLDYLFKVVENCNNFSDTFVDNTIKEIEELLTLPKEDAKIKE